MRDGRKTEDARRAISYHELAERWSVSRPTVGRMVQRLGIRTMRLSATCIRIPLSEVERVERESLDTLG